jgi:hypothetical protein
MEAIHLGLIPVQVEESVPEGRPPPWKTLHNLQESRLISETFQDLAGSPLEGWLLPQWLLSPPKAQSSLLPSY